MQTGRKKTCLVLASPAQSPEHAALFERLGRELGFELIRLQGAADRAKRMLEASFVLADVSGNDPDVMYCLGVAHTFGKRVFLVTDTIDSLPYDLASCRAWIIDPASDNREIVTAMAQFLSVPYAIGPVRVFLGKFAYFGENLIGLRFAAFVIDAAWMLALFGILLYFVVPSDPASVGGTLNAWFAALDGSFETTDDVTPVQTVVVLMVYGSFGYFALSTWLLRATLGQYLLGLRVVQTDYRRATFGQCVGRSVLSVLVIMTYGAAFLSAMRRPGYRAVHDALSGTIVVRIHAF